MSNFESLPLSTLLKECTREAHERIGSSPGAVALVRGGLQKKEYIKYLMVLWHVYDALETSLEQHATHPAIAPTYKPELFGRRSRLVADISFFLDVPEDTWKKHPMHVSLMKDMPKALTTYVARIRELAAAPDPSQLLAHAYIRYMGDLSGGQMIRHGIGKAYDLDETSGKGLSFCAFQELDSDKPASKEEILRIKDWFREGMDRSGEQGEELKVLVVDEAHNAYSLNAGILNTIKINEIVVKPHGVHGNALSLGGSSLGLQIMFTAAIATACGFFLWSSLSY